MDNGQRTWSSATVPYPARSEVIWRRGMVLYEEPHVSRAEEKIRSALFTEKRSKLERRLAREAAEHKAMNDASSRRRAAPASGAPPAHRRLQTYDNAMAARMAARRVG